MGNSILFLAFNQPSGWRDNINTGKLHAILQRLYTKGRDVYDLLWYLSDPAWPQPNLVLLNNTLAQTQWTGERINGENWKELAWLQLKTLIWHIVMDDVRPFVDPGFDIGLLTLANLEKVFQI